MGEALQVPRPARDIHEAVARTPPVASRPCAPGCWRLRRGRGRSTASDPRRVGCIRRLAAQTRSGQRGPLAGDPRVRGRQRPTRNRRRRWLCLRAVPAEAGHGYCASKRVLLRAKGSTPSSRAAPGATSMTRIMLMMLISRCWPPTPRESAYSMSAPTAGPATAP